MITPKPREFKFVIKKAPDGFSVIWDMSYSFEPGNFQVIEHSAYATACKERDEANRMWVELTNENPKQFTIGNGYYSGMILVPLDDLNKVEKERDEYKRQLENCSQDRGSYWKDEYAKACGQRDEARTALASQDKAYADSKCELLEARAEVDKLKEKQKWMGENSLTATLQELLAETAVALEKISRCQMVAYKNQAIESKARNVVAIANDMLTKLKSHMAGGGE